MLVDNITNMLDYKVMNALNIIQVYLVIYLVIGACKTLCTILVLN